MNANNSLKIDFPPLARDLLLRLLPSLPQGPEGPWLVGGTLRDLVKGLTPKDFDIAFSVDITSQIKAWARHLGGKWFWLDRCRNQSRVLFDEEKLQFDFAPLRADGIIEDLGLRDFTCNAMALPLTQISEDVCTLIDPMAGHGDLESDLLRSCGATVLKDDPLRVLKGVRHCAQQGMQIDDLTLQQMKIAVPLLSTVAGERIRNELGLILASDRFVEALKVMHSIGALNELFPTISTQNINQDIDQYLERQSQLMDNPFLNMLLETPVEEGLNCSSILRLTILIKRVSSLPLVDQILFRLRCSNRSQSIMRLIYTTCPFLDDFKVASSPRVAALKIEAFGVNCVEQVLYGLMLLNHQNLDALMADHLCSYYHHLKDGRIADLLDGYAILSLNDKLNGREVGDWQEKIKEAEIAGEISTAEEAASWLLTQLSN